MQRSITTKLVRHSFWLSILLHLLLLLCFLALITAPLSPKKIDERPIPSYVVPAYTYTGSIKPSIQSKASQRKQKAESLTSKSHQTEKAAIQKVNTPKNSQTPEMIKSREPSPHTLPIQKVKKTSTIKHQM